MYVRMYACMHACMNVCMYVRVCVCVCMQFATAAKKFAISTRSVHVVFLRDLVNSRGPRETARLHARLLQNDAIVSRIQNIQQLHYISSENYSLKSI